MLFQNVCEGFAGELRALVAVEYIRSSRASLRSEVAALIKPVAELIKLRN